MEAICPKCGFKKLVHSHSWRGNRIPICNDCGNRMKRTPQAEKTMRSRAAEASKGISEALEGENKQREE